ncbi:hypothetical protein PoB_003967600 [Plakobranchus ocellatus]|uniref:Uncharacterized protein n=1 Tax=Plakobranchus ocellatus TaxID=259542 RepID=A0AAV4B2W3_9GAST|nr:hypothetical protein PoB_003967600 [Plakobranchus ocellatus]
MPQVSVTAEPPVPVITEIPAIFTTETPVPDSLEQQVFNATEVLVMILRAARYPKWSSKNQSKKNERSFFLESVGEKGADPEWKVLC